MKLCQRTAAPHMLYVSCVVCVALPFLLGVQLGSHFVEGAGGVLPLLAVPVGGKHVSKFII
jgi:hypothetical protein